MLATSLSRLFCSSIGQQGAKCTGEVAWKLYSLTGSPNYRNVKEALFAAVDHNTVSNFVKWRSFSNLPENTVYSGPTASAGKRVTLKTLRQKYEKKEPLSMVTAYDYPSAVHVRTVPLPCSDCFTSVCQAQSSIPVQHRSFNLERDITGACMNYIERASCIQ